MIWQSVFWKCNDFNDLVIENLRGFSWSKVAKVDARENLPDFITGNILPISRNRSGDRIIEFLRIKKPWVSRESLTLVEWRKKLISRSKQLKENLRSKYNSKDKTVHRKIRNDRGEISYSKQKQQQTNTYQCSVRYNKSDYWFKKRYSNNN